MRDVRLYDLICVLPSDSDLILDCSGHEFERINIGDICDSGWHGNDIVNGIEWDFSMEYQIALERAIEVMKEKGEGE